MNIAQLLEAIGPEKIEFQWLKDCIGGHVSAKKGRTRLTIQTSAVTVENVAFGTGPVGIIVWLPRDKFDAIIAEHNKAKADTEAKP